ncbi:hypothetical protein RQM59_10620 [Flavobacteriaceae bacterium S356]|uniref:DUF4179 domain-containing protein n=1 Tax=Asprobacillus argus TaxID=3076534 RepID=A0ABU3LGH9_9FLAO|nr:hypothetical protein [Flavobacteriaceae bacterium S356]
MSKKENIHNNSSAKGSFLDRNYANGNVSEHHKELLGTDIPEGYFKNSKQRILDLVKEDAPKKQKVVLLRPRFKYAIAASVAILVSLTIWFQSSSGLDSSELNELADDALINSLFVEDTDMEAFTNDILVSEVMVKAEISEQSLENVFMNSLFVEDSLVDDYMGKSLLENVIL